MVTKDRIGAGLAVVAAVIGLVLMFTYQSPESDADDDDGPAAPPSVSQVAPAPGGAVAPAPGGAVAPAPGGQTQTPAPGQVQQPTPAPPQKPADNDGDDDDG